MKIQILQKKFFFILFGFFLLIVEINSQKITLPRCSEVCFLQATKYKQLLKNPIQPNIVNLSFLNQAYDSIYNTDYYKNSKIQINPIVNNSIYTDLSGENFFQTGNGLRVLSAKNKYLSFDINYTFNYVSLPGFAKEKIDSTTVIPHYSKAKNKDGNYYFHNFVGEIIYSPDSYINLSFGNKHSFLGNGIRSLFLSDNSGNFLSFKAMVDIWNINYLFQTSFLKDIYKLEQPYEMKKKFGTFHFISWDVTPKFNINFFESVIWAPDDSTINRGYDINYLNPVVFLRPVEFSVGSPDNMLLGIGGNYEILENILFYSQFLLDEFNISYIRETEKWWANKFGYQFGIKYWQRNLSNSIIINLEHNWMRPFTFTHAYPSKSYGNVLQSLSHPLGANFREWLSSINYSKDKLFVENILLFQQYGSDSLSTNYGNNIYKSYDTRSLDYGSKILQGIQNNVLFEQLTISYLILPKWFTFVDFSLTYRSHQFENNTISNFYISLGIRTGFNRKNVFDDKY